MKVQPAIVLVVLAISFVGPVAIVKAPVASSSSTSIGPCIVSLCNSPNPQNSTFNPSTIPNYFGQDIGTFNTKTAANGFTWLTSSTDNMTMNLPTVAAISVSNSLVYYNSTHTVYQFSGVFGSLNVLFKAQQYRVKISIHVNLLAPQSVCLPFTAPNPIIQNSFTNQTTHVTTFFPSARAGNEIFDWNDIPNIYSPTFSASKLCLSLPIGITNIDPLALDGSGSCGANAGGALSCSASLTTANSPDVIIAIVSIFNAASHAFSSLTSTHLTFTQRGSTVVSPDNTKINAMTFCAIASSTLSAESITLTVASSTYYSLIVFGISGANTNGCSAGNSFDSNGGLPFSNTAAGTPNDVAVSYSTSNANDFIIAEGFNDAVANNQLSFTTGGPWTDIAQQGNGGIDTLGSYQIVSATQSSVSVNLHSTAGHDLAIIIDAVQQAAATVTQAIKITTLTAGAPSATITISGCAVSNGTFTANGNLKTYTGITASCTITLTEPADGANSRYRWNISPHPTAATAITFSTCAGPGTCTEYDNTTYYQLRQTYKVTPSSPTTWDGAYPLTVKGTLLGSAGNPLCTATNTVTGGGIQGVCPGNTAWADYNLAVTIGSPIGNTWFANPFGSNIFTDTTGGNTDNTNYVQAAGGDPPNYLWLLLIPMFMLMFLVVKRLR